MVTIYKENSKVSCTISGRDPGHEEPAKRRGLGEGEEVRREGGIGEREGGG